MAQISIIVPVYNIYDRLADCLDSICGQTLTDWECILVDDGSTDGSAQILDRYAQADPRLLVIHQKNAGVGAARNRGLQQASGDYITFVDSDDRIGSEYLEELTDAIGDHDILIAGFTLCAPDGETPIGFVSGPPATDQLAQAMKTGLLNSCWGKLYRHSAISGIRFSEEILWGEDTAFLMDCLCRTKSILFLPSHRYLYTYSTTGLANRFDQQKPRYLQVYYRHLLAFLDDYAAEGDALFAEICIKISQEMLRTVDALRFHGLGQAETNTYLKTLFSDSRINQLFRCGILQDQNPAILKVFSCFPHWAVWKTYLLLRSRKQRGTR